MTRSIIGSLATFAVALALGACSGNDGKISVQSANAQLTDKGQDQLFTVTLDDGRSDGYDLKSLLVKVTPDGKDPIPVIITVSDKNGNGKLDKGETVTCVEGPGNDFGPDIAGKEAKVELFATIDGKSDERVGDATWTPQ